jgi:hypothetical protein
LSTNGSSPDHTSGSADIERNYPIAGDHDAAQSDSDPNPWERDSLTAARLIFRRALEYIPEPGKETASSGQSELESWLAAKPSRWLVKVAEGRLTDTTGSVVSFLVGEEGSGKTTALRNAARTLKKQGLHIVHIDFSAEGGLDKDATYADLNVWLFRAVRNAARRSLATQQERDELDAARVRHLIPEGRHYRFEDLRRRRGSEFADKMTDQALMADSEVLLSLAVYEQSEANLFDPLFFELIQQFKDRRMVVLCDNADHYGPVVVAHIFNELTTRLRGDTIFLGGVRPEFAHLAQDKRQGRPTRLVDLQQRHDKALMLKIALKRIDAGMRFIMSRQPELREQGELVYSRYRRGLDLLRIDDPLYGMVCQWTNYNYRQAVDYIVPIFKAPNISGRAFRNYMWGLLMAEMPSNLLQIFRARPIHTAKWPSLPFVFLRIRLLSLVNLHSRSAKSALSVGDICDSMSDWFGISRTMVVGALEEMCEKHHGSGSLLRLGLARDPMDRAVTILPAGSLFIDSIIYKVDFLSHAYLAREEPTPHAPRRPRKPVEKAGRAAAQVDEILDSFIAEHPYMEVRREIRRDEGRRLRAYSNFGYGKGRWFISALRRSLNGYGDASADVGLIVKGTVDRIREHELQLNRALDLSR